MKTFLAMVLSLWMSLPLLSQNIAAFSGTKTPKTATVPNITAEALSRGPGVTAAGGNTFNSGNWATGNKLDPNDYIQWSVTADPGYIISINEFQISFDRDPDGFSHFFAGNGPAKIRIRSSLDNFKTDLYANDKISNSGQTPNVETSLTSSPGGTITFRLYGFSSNIGMLGPLGTLDIEGELGTVLELEQTGIRLSGQVTYDGLLYSQGNWTPHAPNANTGDKNVLISNGIYSVSDKVKVKNLWVQPQASVVVQKTGAITVNENLTTENNIVLQSDANSFSSLIVKGAMTGKATYQRQVNITTPLGGLGNQVLLSAPVSGEPFNVFRGSNPNIVTNKAKNLFYFGPYNKIKGSYDTYSNKETVRLTAATGYRTATKRNGIYTFKGKVNTDTITKKIVRSGPTHPEWNLIGNPYPSYVTITEFLAANTAEFDPEYSGIYSYDGDPSNGWHIRNQAYLTVHPHAKLTPGEGFLVAAKKGGGEVIFTPQMRCVGEVDTFKIKQPSVAKNVGFLELNLSNGIAHYSTDFYFNDASTPGLDPGYDAAIYGGKAPEFAIYSQLVDRSMDQDMAIQSLAYDALADHTIIPLGVNAPEGQQLTIHIKTSLLPEETKVVLEDQQERSFTLLNTNDYEFMATSKISGTQRFRLHILNSTLSYGTQDFDALQVYTTNRARILHIKEAVKSETLVTVFDLQERLLIKKEFDEGSTENSVDLSSLKSGVYLVKVKTGKLEKIKKIMLDAHSYPKIEAIDDMNREN